jgi:hypothetical protein
MCDKVCHDIAAYIQKYKQTNPNSQDIVLVIQVKEASDGTDSLVPKLEYKNE